MSAKKKDNVQRNRRQRCEGDGGTRAHAIYLRFYKKGLLGAMRAKMPKAQYSGITFVSGSKNEPQGVRVFPSSCGCTL